MDIFIVNGKEDPVYEELARRMGVEIVKIDPKDSTMFNPLGFASPLTVADVVDEAGRIKTIEQVACKKAISNEEWESAVEIIKKIKRITG